MPRTEINYLAVVVAAILNMLIGFIWYGPAFGKVWLQLVGLRMEDVDRTQLPKAYGLSFLGALAMMYVLSGIVDVMQATTLRSGALAGLWVWLGFFVAGGASRYIFPFKPLKLFALDNAYHLVVLVAMGALLAVWI
jgi:uncharacterized membrane protein